MNLGNTLKSLRKEKGFKQAELAKLSGISQSYLSEIENNKKLPDIEMLETIGNTLGLPVVAIFLRAFNKEDMPSEGKEHIINNIKQSIERLETLLS
ncbi:MAG: helix-turn-helix transcriptional regulator [Phaeodactylibacter sp.]|nr:helix-turn-helix transcriptional regulator [Phaeodactylibacter sp.]